MFKWIKNLMYPDGKYEIIGVLGVLGVLGVTNTMTNMTGESLDELFERRDAEIRERIMALSVVIAI